MTYKNYKITLFSVLVLSMIVSIAGINIANASQEKVNVGKVDDGTYNEDLAFQRALYLVNSHDEKKQQKAELEYSLVTKQKIYDESIKNFKFVEAFLLLLEIEAIKSPINQVQGSIDVITLEYDEIQKENMKLYYIEPSLYEEYVVAKDDIVNKIHKQYWDGKSFEEAKEAFPLVAVGINHKQKAVEITLFMGVANSTKKNEYIATIEKWIPNDIPWFVTYEDYAMSTACTDRFGACDPLMGGIEIREISKGPCTLGIQATRNSLNGFITAGHCHEGSSFGADVLQPFAGSVVGDFQIGTFSNNSPCDCAFIADRTANPIVDNAIFNTSTSTYTPTTATSAGGQAGQMVKMSGKTTGISTGTVTNTNVSVPVYPSGFTITNAVKASITSACGDSGAPITNGLGSSFFGIQFAKSGTGCISSGNPSYYSPYDQIQLHLGANPVLG